MAEYIEREALIKTIENDCLELVYYTKEDAIQCVKAIPAADVAPVVHAYWLLRHVGYGHYWECSNCHTNPCIYVTENTKYCLHCGAKMDADPKEREGGK